MDRPHMRPRLDIVVTEDIQAVREAFEARVAHPTCTCVGKFASNHLHVEVGPDKRHFWSPTLDVTLRPTESGTVLKGRFGPHPNVWTLYVFIYAAWSFMGIVSGCWLIAQWAMGTSPTALWGIALAVVLAVATWVSARVGASIGHAQMEDLFGMVDGLGSPVRDEAHVVHDDVTA